MSIRQLPDNGIPSELLTMDDVDDITDSDEGEEANAHSHSFLPLPRREPTEANALESAIYGQDTIDWPTIENHPINEFKTPGLATQAFPTLFPYGTGDPTVPGRHHKISLAEAFKHLIRYADKVDGNFVWRFANHPRFPYWALNMKQRHQLISQSTVYLQQHPSDAQLTVENLRDMVGHLSAEQLMQRLQHYAAKVQGSSQYWYQR